MRTDAIEVHRPHACAAPERCDECTRRVCAEAMWADGLCAECHLWFQVERGVCWGWKRAHRPGWARGPHYAPPAVVGACPGCYEPKCGECMGGDGRCSACNDADVVPE